MCLEPFFARWGGNQQGGEEYALQFLYTKGNCQSTQSYIGIKNGNTFSASIIKDVDLALKALEIVYRTNGDAVEGLDDWNGHIRKVVVEGKIVSRGGARTNGKGRKCELTNKMFLQSDLSKLCLKKNTTSLTSSLTPLFFTIRKLALQVNRVKNAELLTNHIVLYTSLTEVKPYQNILEQF